MMNTGKKFYLSVVKPENFTSIQRFTSIFHLFSVILRIFVYKREFYNFTSDSAFYVDTGVIIATYNFFEKRSTCVKLIISEDNGKLNISNLTAIGQERTRLFIFLNSLEYCTVVLFNCFEAFV